MWQRECGTGNVAQGPGTGSRYRVWVTRSIVRGQGLGTESGKQGLLLIRYGDIFVIQRKLNKNAWKRASTGIPSKSGMAFSKGHLVIRHLL